MEKRHLRILRYTGSFSSQKQMVSQSFIPMISLNLTWTITFLTRQISCCLTSNLDWMSWRSVPKVPGSRLILFLWMTLPFLTNFAYAALVMPCQQ